MIVMNLQKMTGKDWYYNGNNYIQHIGMDQYFNVCVLGRGNGIRTQGCKKFKTQLK